jgi:hypothetical protein
MGRSPRLSDQCRQAWQQDPEGLDASQPDFGSTSLSPSSAPCSRMYLRPDRIGWSAPRVASSTPSQSLAPAAREKRRTRSAAKRPLVRFRSAASRETRCARSPPIEATAARATCGLEQVRRISRTITGSLLLSSQCCILWQSNLFSTCLCSENLLSSRKVNV